MPVGHTDGEFTNCLSSAEWLAKANRAQEGQVDIAKRQKPILKTLWDRS